VCVKERERKRRNKKGAIFPSEKLFFRLLLLDTRDAKQRRPPEANGWLASERYVASVALTRRQKVRRTRFSISPFLFLFSTFRHFALVRRLLSLTSFSSFLSSPILPINLAFGVAHVVDASGALVPAYVVHGEKCVTRARRTAKDESTFAFRLVVRCVSPWTLKKKSASLEYTFCSFDALDDALLTHRHPRNNTNETNRRAGRSRVSDAGR
jgi:hypothetical protein